MSSLLTKRNSINSLDQKFEDQKLKFLTEYIPQLLESTGRMKYFIDYEFPRKQNMLKVFWQRTLNLFFKQYKEGAIVYWMDLLEVFTINHSYPIGLDKILIELVNEGEYRLLSSESEFAKLGNLFNIESIENSEEDSIWNKFKGFFRPKVPLINNNTIVVNIREFQILFSKVESCLPQLFGDQKMLPENDFLLRFSNMFNIYGVNKQAILDVAFSIGKILKIRENSLTFYYLKQKGADDALEVEASKRELIIEHKITQIDNNLAQLKQKIEDILENVRKLKKQGRKQEALNALLQKKQIATHFERINSKRDLLTDILFKIKNAGDERDLAEILKKTNDIFKDKDKNFEIVTDAVENINLLNNQQEAMDNMINDLNGKAEIEDLYNQLDNSHEVGVVNDYRINKVEPVNLVVSSSKGKKSERRESVKKMDEELSESQIFKQRIEDLLE